MTSDAKILETQYSKSIIRSSASLTYDQAQAYIDGKNLKHTSNSASLSKSISRLNMLAKKLRKIRIDRGALTLASPEVKFQLEDCSDDPVDVEMKELKEANALVEEFMLLANISVASKIYEKYAECALLRYILHLFCNKV